MRHRSGDSVLATDGMGTEYSVELCDVSPDSVTGRVVTSAVCPREPRHRIVVAQALLKHDKLAQSCEQLAELGVAELLPFGASRSQARTRDAKQERLQNVALSGMKSSTGSLLMKVSQEVELAGLAGRFGEFDRVLLAYEEERQAGLAGLLSKGIESVLLIIGPEGGFAPPEVETLRQAGAVVFSLGPRRLRSETAAVVATAALMQLLGDLEQQGVRQTSQERRC
jgi:16S rRNA (uracil1498-N3)-methyltransferase